MVSFNPLSDEEKRVIVYKGTEAPYTGEYTDHEAKGLYICRQCNAPLYYSRDKFHSGCGWPSFDDSVPGAVRRVPDADGHRTEIVCENCKGHLGHVFEGEGFTEKNTRHCVNSISMRFIPDEKLETAIFAAGCFWGVEFYFKRLKGVVLTRVGYTGGEVNNPSYEEVCSKKTGHFEAIEVTFQKEEVSYEAVLKYFFEIHDFEQENGQGPDLGPQYRSAIFYLDEEQKRIAEEVVTGLQNKGYQVATQILPAQTFWSAEEYHQNYYEKKGGSPYCHTWRKIF